MILGVDAGGTRTRAVLVRDGAVVDRFDEGPLNAALDADAAERLAALIMRSGAERAGVGVPGLRREQAQAELAAKLSTWTGVRVAVADDGEIALRGAFRGGPGIAVVAGTGSIALGRDAAGRRARAGGHGYLLGDEGGGYWIGREAVRAALRSYDGTGPQTELEELVPARLGGSLAWVVETVYASPVDRSRLAGLVPLVADAARADGVAAALLDEAGDRLAELARAVRTQLGDLDVAAVGGVFRVRAVLDRFQRQTGALEPAEPPELGAVRLAQAAS